MVADRDPQLAVDARDLDLHGGAVGRVDEGVAEQVGEDLAQLQGVAADGRGTVCVQSDLAPGSAGAGVLHRVARERGDVDRLAVSLRLLVEPREREQVLHQHAHPCGLFLDPAHRPRVARGVARCAHPEQLGVAADRGERRAQLVGGVGEELAQPLFAGGPRGEGLLEALEHRVEREPEASDLGLGGRRAHPSRQVPGGDLPGGHLDAAQGSQPETDDEVGR